MNAIRKIVYKYPVISSLLLILVEYWILETPFYYDSSNMVYQIIKEIVLALIALAFIYFINGKSEIVYSNKGMGFAFKKSWWALTIMFVLGLMIIVLFTLAGSPFVSNSFVVIVEYLILGLFVGLFEEALIRGSLFNALLARNGSTFKGIITAMIISSIFFGFIHVLPDLTDAFPNISLSAAGQMVGKTIQSGMFGFLLAAIYLKNHNLWSVALVHAVNDILVFIPPNLYVTQTAHGYVQSSGNFNSVFSYVFMSILSIPFIFTAVKIVKTVSLPQPGMFKVSWFPLNVKK